MRLTIGGTLFFTSPVNERRIIMQILHPWPALGRRQIGRQAYVCGPIGRAGRAQVRIGHLGGHRCASRCAPGLANRAAELIDWAGPAPGARSLEGPAESTIGPSRAIAHQVRASFH